MKYGPYEEIYEQRSFVGIGRLMRIAHINNTAGVPIIIAQEQRRIGVESEVFVQNRLEWKLFPDDGHVHLVTIKLAEKDRKWKARVFPKAILGGRSEFVKT